MLVRLRLRLDVEAVEEGDADRPVKVLNQVCY